METTLSYGDQIYCVEYETNRIEGEEDVGISNHTEITIKHVWVNLPAPFLIGGEVIVTIYTEDISDVDDVDISDNLKSLQIIEDEIRKQF